MLKSLQNTLAMETTQPSEMFISTLGVFVAMCAVVLVTQILHDGLYPWFVIASMGASAIILFASPHVAMAQPWSLVGGQMVAAVCGLAAWSIFPEATLAVPVAVAATILAMLILRCRHAPGGATALFIALGGAEVEALGWSLLWVSLLPSVLTLLFVAVVYNLPFSWRRYPYLPSPKTEVPQTCDINHQDLVYASDKLNGYFEMSEQEFLALYRAAREHHQKSGTA